MSRLFSLVEHIQLNTALSHLLKGQSAASKLFHFSFTIPSIPRSQFDDLFVFLWTTKYLTGIANHGQEVKGPPYSVFPLVILSSSTSHQPSLRFQRFKNSSQDSKSVFYFQSVMWSVLHQIFTET